VAQHEVEVILLRQLASELATPVVIVDAQGDLLYFNEAAEAIVGRRFEDTGDIRRDEWSARFEPSQVDGSPLKPEEQLLSETVDRHQPIHGRFWMRGLDGVRRLVEGTSLPLIGQNGRHLGAFAFFWEVDRQ
jgi:PAS domain-containing protein